jgi:hypothetical protein
MTPCAGQMGMGVIAHPYALAAGCARPFRLLLWEGLQLARALM